MLNFLYMVFIYPVYMFVEFIFFMSNNITEDYTGLSIIILSFTINIICLPIYNVAETLQVKEREIQKKLKAKIKDIKEVFKGDERYMILSTYYRQNNYHPIYALRSMFAMFIQIPFFIAAYKLLSDLPVLQNHSFLFLNNLGSPDGLLRLGNITVNILPIVMTLINLAASVIYTKGLPLKDKLQLYIISVLFLILLYDSPSGLVFYWTLNNLFSLFKNIFYKIKLSAKTWYVISLIFLVFFTIIIALNATRRKPVLIMAAVTLVIILIPLIKKLCFYLKRKHAFSILDDDKERFKIFFISAASLMLFIGLVIPSATIASSPQEFSNFENFKNPLGILYYTVIQSIGCFLWLICLYKLFNKNVQKYFAYIIVISLTSALINAFVFNGDYGDINNLLVFQDPERLKHSLKYFCVNILVLTAGACAAGFIIYSKIFSRFIKGGAAVIFTAFVVFSGISSISIYRNYMRIENDAYIGNPAEKAYKVSKTGKNIFILMLDRSMNFFIDPILENSKIVKKEYTGFTLFENSIAFGISTNMSTPSLFGGYEYTPENIDKRSSELLVDKHNEALSVLPKLFSENNWHVSFTDPCWLNYSWIPALSVFDKYEMTAENIEASGKYRQKFIQKLETFKNLSTGKRNMGGGIRRNMLYFSFFRILPAEIRRVFYSGGNYTNIYMPQYFNISFIDSYSSLENLNEEIEFVDDRNCLNIVVNNTTHEPPSAKDIQIIKKDFLIPMAEKYCLNQYTAEHFYANYLAHEECAKFFRFLKENSCWDNSRIIIVGDHGRYSMRTKNMTFIENFENENFLPESLIPLFMIKDFDSGGELKKDRTFMTLADVVILTTEGLPPELQKNPFSQIPFKESRNKKVVKVMCGGNWQADTQLNLTRFQTTEKDWVFVKDNVYDPTCWSNTCWKDN